MSIMIENLDCDKTGSCYSQTIAFSIVTRKNDKRYRVIDWASCRDYINDALIANINGKHKDGQGRKIEYDIDFKKLRLLINYQNKSKQDAIFAAKRMINAYEKIAGFKEKSVISSALDTQALEFEPPICLLTGPSEWLKCSQLVSLITLVTRIFYRIDDKISKDISFENIKEINEFWEGIVTKKCYSSITDISSFASNYKRWGVLMENFTEIFDGLNTEDLYPKNLTSEWHSSGGIVSLSNMQTQIKKLDNRLEKLFRRTNVMK